MKLSISKSAEKVIYAVIVLNLIAMVVESEPDLPQQFISYLEYFEIFSISLFSIEYIIRTFIAYRNKNKYNTSFFGAIDLLSVLPFYFQSLIGFDGRFVRVFRLFRVSRILKLGKFNKSFELLGRGISNVKKELLKLTFLNHRHIFFF